MKKTIFGWMTIALMAFVCASFVACGGGSDDDAGGGVNASPLVGTWNLTESGSNSDSSWQGSDTFVFNADGTGTYTSVGWTSYRQQKYNYNIKESFNYSAVMSSSNAGILTVVFTSTESRTVGKPYYWSFVISGKTLSVNEGYDVGSDYTKTYTKK